MTHTAEIEDDDRVHAGLSHQREAFGEGRDQDGCASGLKHLDGVRLEGTGERLDAAASPDRDRGAEDRAMALVDAVEGAEGKRARGRVRREGLESPDDPHGECGRAGACRPPR